MSAESTASGMGRANLRQMPVPSWVAHEAYSRSKDPEEAFVANGLCRLLQDVQIDLTGPEVAWHFRNANHVVTQAGAETAAHVSIDFDPHFQSLDIHFVRVLRGDEVIDRTNIESFDVLRRERDLERRILNGRLTAALLLPDVRPGDVVEICVTLYGEHPVLRNRYGAWTGFDGLQPVVETRHRVRHLTGRPLAIKNVNDPPNPEIITADGVTDLRWRAERRPRVHWEEFAPPWAIQGAAVQISDYASWTEVARLFTPLYDDRTVPKELLHAIDDLASRYSTPEARAAEALRYVQKRLRYLALSLREGGLTPRSLDAICAAGYGDCKDAARLFTAVARGLGLDACPALISTTYSPVLNTMLPDGTIFNHCIARLRFGAKTYWLDPTMRPQSGNLDRVVQPYSGWALPLTAETESLEQMAAPTPLIVVELDEHFAFGPKVDSPANYERRITYSSWRADLLRDNIANHGLVNVAKSQMKELEPAWPGIAETTPMTVEDEPDINKITTIQRFQLPGGWKSNSSDPKVVSFSIFDTVIAHEVHAFPGGPRIEGLYLGRPRTVRRSVHFHMPRDWRSNFWDETLEAPGLTYRWKLEPEELRLIVFSQLVTVSAETAPGSSVEQLNKIVEAIRKKGDIVLSALNARGKLKCRQRSSSFSGWGYWWIIYAIIMFLMYLGRAITTQ